MELPQVDLGLSFDEVLTTTRAVRRRLDIGRPVPRRVLEECLEIALQAPNGSNRNGWRWILVDDPEVIRKLAAEYRTAVSVMNAGHIPSPNPITVQTPGSEKIFDSAMALVEKFPGMPAVMVPLMPGRPDGLSSVEQASMWGSILPAVWSFLLALRSRGLGSVWATVSTRREQQIADILGIDTAEYTQVGMFPIAYTHGSYFKKAWRKPVSEVLDWNCFTQKKELLD